jgi:putative ABC transport system substrate-binding protein
MLSKRLDLLRELVPGVTRVAVLVNPANPQRAETQVQEVEAAGGAMGLQIQIFRVGSSRDINAAFATFAHERPDAILVGPDPFFVVRRVQLATLAIRHGLPSSFSVRDNAEAGGLMSYGTDIGESYRQSGVYAGRVLKGAKPADLPVVQSTRFQLVINAQTALTLGLPVPTSLLARADEVIECAATSSRCSAVAPEARMRASGPSQARKSTTASWWKPRCHSSPKRRATPRAR